ncbi:hypothetical protein VPH35_087974 [Triticum aestivum]
MSKDKAAIAISVMWAIWSSRNKYTHEEIKFQPSRSMDLIQELIQALHVPGMPSSGVTLCKAKWHPPAAGTIKINTDAAVDVSERRSSLGVVARDHLGTFVAGRCSKFPGVTDALPDAYVAELLAVREAVLLARDNGWPNILIETDCQVIRNEWKNGDLSSVGGHVLREIKSCLSNFQGFDIVYTRRDANVVAHRCANEGLSSSLNVISFNVIPDFLVALVQSDIDRRYDE